MSRLTRTAFGCSSQPGVRAASFSTTPSQSSNIGRSPISIPTGTTLQITPKQVDEVTASRAELDKMRQGKPKIHLTQESSVKGPQGEMRLELADFVQLNVAENRADVSVPSPEVKCQRTMWGTTRTLIANAVTGVNEGHLCIVKLVGTGFRAQLENVPASPTKKPASEAPNDAEPTQQVVSRVGFSVPKIALVPRDLKVSVPVPHRIIIEGVDKQKVMASAATIRAFRKPEPYKGKGIFINDETIKSKQKKIK